jgi:septal ring factor EnvC (AmiA/AmiB activator)
VCATQPAPPKPKPNKKLTVAEVEAAAAAELARVKDEHANTCDQLRAQTATVRERAVAAEEAGAALQAQVKRLETTVQELNARLADTKGSHSEQVRGDTGCTHPLARTRTHPHPHTSSSKPTDPEVL